MPIFYTPPPYVQKGPTNSTLPTPHVPLATPGDTPPIQRWKGINPAILRTINEDATVEVELVAQYVVLPTVQAADGTATSTSTAVAVGRATSTSAGTITVAATATGIGQITSIAAGTATSTSTAQAQTGPYGTATATATVTATGLSTTLSVGTSVAHSNVYGANPNGITKDQMPDFNVHVNPLYAETLTVSTTVKTLTQTVFDGTSDTKRFNQVGNKRRKSRFAKVYIDSANSIRYTKDGTAPVATTTGALGRQFEAVTLQSYGEIEKFKAISDNGSDSTIQVEYYG